MVKLANVIKNNKLVSYSEWCYYIDLLAFSANIKDEKKAITLIKPKLKSAIQKRIPNKKFGILFSGGVDSALIAYICKKYTKEFTCYTVGIEGSRDIEWSKKVAKVYGLKHKINQLSLSVVEELFEKTANILGKDLINIVNIGVGSVVLAGFELAKKDNVHIIFTGLGSEEIFAGYQRHENSDNINKECLSGLKSTWIRDFQRDVKLADNHGIEVLTPFLDKELIITAMGIDGSLKIKKGFKKYILRKTAESLGLKREFAFRKKIAAQYGSSFDKAMQKIAKAKGLTKREYLNYLGENK